MYCWTQQIHFKLSPKVVMQVSTSTRVTSGLTAVLTILATISIGWNNVPWVIAMTSVLIPIVVVGASVGLAWFIYEMLRIAVTGKM